jgi:hypothetical protein
MVKAMVGHGVVRVGNGGKIDARACRDAVDALKDFSCVVHAAR